MIGARHSRREARLKTSVFIATSLDGFIARPDDTFDWLPDAGSPDGDYGYSAFVETVDALVLGRRTYEVVLGFDVWPYGTRPVYVLSTHPIHVPTALQASIHRLAAAPEAVVRQLETMGYRHVWVDGGDTIRRFLRSGLLDELILTRVPVLIGSGIALFGALDQDVWLEHLDTRTLPEGMIQSTYRILR